ncbi:hypothetical protein DL93DRAFT_1096702 [Clavulina sp. PMI_390]|nr:hypothetical protein DL93DRAFT_1096702 [Clavulina sp. PMI_390]
MAFIAAVLRSRPDVVINLCAGPPLVSGESGHGDVEREERSFFPLELQAVATQFGSHEERAGARVSGRLELLSSPTMLVWPEAWGFIRPDTT